MSCGVGCRLGLDLAWLGLWCRPAAVAPIQPLAWEPPYATSIALKSKKKKKKSLLAFQDFSGAPATHLRLPSKIFYYPESWKAFLRIKQRIKGVCSELVAPLHLSPPGMACRSSLAQHLSYLTVIAIYSPLKNLQQIIHMRSL